MRDLSPSQLTVTLSVLVAGLAGAVTALGSREADDAFLRRQANPVSIVALELERVVRSAPEPVVRPRRTPVRTARCRPGSATGLRNPWECAVSYRSGRTTRARITVRAGGSYAGRYVEGAAVIEGCCLRIPGAG